MKYTNAELCLIWLDSFIGLEYRHKQQLYKNIIGKAEIRKVLVDQKEYIISQIGLKEYNTLTSSATPEYLSFILDGLDRQGVRAVTIQSNEYPQKLKEIDIPPLVLYCKGDIGLLNSESFAIVGSRRNIPLSITLAKNYTNAICDMQLVVVSGNADGVDHTVLQTATERNSKVISVIAGGIACYNGSPILQKVEKCGLVVGEYPPETPSLPFYFPVRNRIIAGLAKGTLIVSGGIKSGTNYTAEYCESYGRDLFVIPYSPNVPSGAGCNELIKRGARLTDSPNDIAEFYGVEQKTQILAITQEEKEVIKLMKDGPIHIDKICQALGKQNYQIISLLSILEIKGIVVKSGTNIFGLTRNDLEV